jgi:hypothetical protein
MRARIPELIASGEPGVRVPERLRFPLEEEPASPGGLEPDAIRLERAHVRRGRGPDGAEQDRDVAQADAPLAQAADRTGDEPCFVRRSGGDEELDRAGSGVPVRLERLLHVAGDPFSERGRTPNDVVNRAIVLRERLGVCAECAREALDVLRRGSAPLVDGLVVVADDADVDGWTPGAR